MALPAGVVNTFTLDGEGKRRSIGEGQVGDEGVTGMRTAGWLLGILAVCCTAAPAGSAVQRADHRHLAALDALSRCVDLAGRVGDVPGVMLQADAAELAWQLGEHKRGEQWVKTAWLLAQRLPDKDEPNSRAYGMRVVASRAPLIQGSKALPLVSQALRATQVPDPRFADSVILSAFAEADAEQACRLARSLPGTVTRAESEAAVARVIAPRSPELAYTILKSALGTYRRLGKQETANWALVQVAERASARHPDLARRLLAEAHVGNDAGLLELMVRAYARTDPDRALLLASKASNPALAARLLCALAQELPSSAGSYVNAAADILMRAAQGKQAGQMAGACASTAIMLADHGKRDTASKLLQRALLGTRSIPTDLDRGRILFLLATAQSYVDPGSNRAQQTLEQALRLIGSAPAGNSYLTLALATSAGLAPPLSYAAYSRMRNTDPAVLLVMAVVAAGEHRQWARSWLAEGTRRLDRRKGSDAVLAQGRSLQAAVEGLLLDNPALALKTAAQVHGESARAAAYLDVAKALMEESQTGPREHAEAIRRLVFLSGATPGN